MVTCVDCGVELPGVRANTRRCGECRRKVHNARGKSWYLANRDHCIARTAAYTAARPEWNRDRARIWRAANPEKHLENQRKHKRRSWGVIDPTGETKSGACYRAGCEYVGPLHFDHWHGGPLKGNFRGWLCPKCNKGAGMFGDSSAALRAMADYIDLAEGIGWPSEIP